MSSSDDQAGVDDVFAQIVAGLDGPADNSERGYLVKAGDRVENNLPEPAREMLAVLAALVAESTELESAPVVHDDPADQEAYAGLAGALLVTELTAACHLVQHSAAAAYVSFEELEAWLKVANTLRVRLTAGVESAADLEQLWAAGGERAQLLGFVAAVQREVLDVLLD